MNEVTINLFRFIFSENGTFGFILDEQKQPICFTVEEVWRNNQRNISSIPEGKYRLISRKTAKRGRHLLLQEVPNRSLILIHAGNTIAHTKGCILPVMELNLNGGEQSKIALEKLNKHIFSLLDTQNHVFLHIQNLVNHEF